MILRLSNYSGKVFLRIAAAGSFAVANPGIVRRLQMVLLQNPINIKRTMIAEEEFKLEEPHKSRRLELKGNLKSTERKVDFIMCWVYEQQEDDDFP
ncbi:hypothetical protein AgCh_021878 [Apium graveolens]